MPYVLRLKSLRVNDAVVAIWHSRTPRPDRRGLSDQPGDATPRFWAQVRFHVILDGHPVRTLLWSQAEGTVKLFSDNDNRDEEGNVFRFWSTADLIVYEADTRGSNVGWDRHPDAWVQTVKLNPLLASDEVQTVVIGDDRGVDDAEKTPSYLIHGRTDASYFLKYTVRRTKLSAENSLFEEIAATNHPSELIDNPNVHGDLRVDKGNCRWICSIDGGGLRGIFPLRMLEQLEAYYGKPCSEMFDMFAGTSTGSIIASMLATGHSVKDVISLYTTLKYRERLFATNQRGQEAAFRYFDLRTAGGDAQESLNEALYANKLDDTIEGFEDPIATLIRNTAIQFCTPRYRKTGMKELLYQFLSARFDDTLQPFRLKDCRCGSTTKDILIAAVTCSAAKRPFLAPFTCHT